MTLAQYLEKNDLSVAQFAKLAKTATWSIDRYKKGRMPSPPVIRRIFKVTKGAVTPNDFYLTAEK